ncbi:MAG: hypothetical protein FWB80_09125 [Defluviitaleaceae bacterium]|nr:hypothetical protein [Defluviitaleaceae bacterium]
MIKIEDLSIVHYCHPTCIPFLNICRLPKEEAFTLAYKMAVEMAVANPEANSYHRFAKGEKGFESYYPRRMMTDEYLYDMFTSLGGKPKEKHPLSFVLQGSEWLDSWFGNGLVFSIKLNTIPSEYISFTLGDSMVMLLQKDGVRVSEIQHGKITMYTKEMLLSSITHFEGAIDDYMNHITDKYKYIEVQLWNDDYCIV